MAGNAQATAASPRATSAGTRAEIARKWSKFTEKEASALKDNDDLVIQIQSKYSLNTEQARKDVDAFAKGRQF